MKKTTRAKILDSNRNLDTMDQPMMNQLLQQLATLQVTMQTMQQEKAELKNRLPEIPLNPIVQAGHLNVKFSFKQYFNCE